MHPYPRLWQCFTKGIYNTVHHDGIEHAGYLAFLGLLALFPFLVFITALIGAVGEDTIAAQYVVTLFNHLPAGVTVALRPRIVEITSGPPQGLLTLAIVGAIWTASSAVEGLRTTLNRAYHVTAPPAYLFRRTLSIIQLLIFAFILLIGVFILVTFPLALHRLQNWLDISIVNDSSMFWSRMLYAGTIVMLFGAVASIYYSIPNVRLRFMQVAPGAVLVIVLWILAAQIFTYYLTHFNQVTLIYGSLGGIIAALLFLYLCNVILIFGAEFNYLFGVYREARRKHAATPADSNPQSHP